jgi:hypothetical protein
MNTCNPGLSLSDGKASGGVASELEQLADYAPESLQKNCSHFSPCSSLPLKSAYHLYYSLSPISRLIRELYKEFLLFLTVKEMMLSSDTSLRRPISINCKRHQKHEDSSVVCCIQPFSVRKAAPGAVFLDTTYPF